MMSPQDFWAGIVALVFLGSLTTLIIGSQGRSDAQFVAGAVLVILAPVILAVIAWVITASPDRQGGAWAALGFFGGLAGAVGAGSMIAARRESRQPPPLGVSDEPIPPDDDLF